jgi:hypothetical protein
MSIDSYCDQSHKGCYLNGEVIDIIEGYLKQLDPEFYQLIAYTFCAYFTHWV